LLPDSEATRGHFPADALKGGAAQIELECADCNQTMNVQYEKAAQDFLTGQWGIEIGLKGTGLVNLRGVIVAEGDKVDIRLAKLSSRGERELTAAMARVGDGSVVSLRVHQPIADALHRALLGWSFLGWSKFAGYLYTASPGAAVVRRLVLDATQALPRTVVFRRADFGPLSLPLPRPVPVILAISPLETVRLWSEVVGVLGIGMHWGSVVVALPFANDSEGAVYERLEETIHLGQARDIHAVSIHDLAALQPRWSQWQARLQDLASGRIHEVAYRPSAHEVDDLAAGRSPYRYAPRTRHQAR
jgi:acid stress-induced BolA-like protein IbaG/YrbA